MVGRLGAMQVLGLPGNPISSLVCGLLFMEPLLCRLGHYTPPKRMATGTLANALPLTTSARIMSGQSVVYS